MGRHAIDVERQRPCRSSGRLAPASAKAATGADPASMCRTRCQAAPCAPAPPIARNAATRARTVRGADARDPMTNAHAEFEPLHADPARPASREARLRRAWSATPAESSQRRNPNRRRRSETSARHVPIATCRIEPIVEAFRSPRNHVAALRCIAGVDSLRLRRGCSVNARATAMPSDTSPVVVETRQIARPPDRATAAPTMPLTQRAAEAATTSDA